MVDYFIDGYIKNIILDSSDEDNIINRDFLLEFDKALDSSNENVRVVIIRSNKKTFCSGMDFKYVVDKKKESYKEFADFYQRILLRIRNNTYPVISLITGDVTAGGLGIVAASDIVIATDNTGFMLSEALFGLSPSVIMPFLIERMGIKKARFLSLTAKKIGADEALRIGLVDDVTSLSGIDKTLQNYIKRILSLNPQALKKVKEYTDILSVLSFEERLKVASENLSDTLNDNTLINSIKEFMEGSPLPWSVKQKWRRDE